MRGGRGLLVGYERGGSIVITLARVWADSWVANGQTLGGITSRNQAEPRGNGVTWLVILSLQDCCILIPWYNVPQQTHLRGRTSIGTGNRERYPLPPDSI
jgi:hypothetical protein